MLGPGEHARWRAATAAAVLIAAPASAQDSLSFRDSLVVRQIAYRAPCPAPAPPTWGLRDPALASGWRCSLVEHAARGLAEYLGIQSTRAGARIAGDPWRPLCVRLVVGTNTGSTGLPGDWMVIFDLAPDESAYVAIDRQTGGLGGVLLSHAAGRGGPADRLPRCTE